VHPAVAGNGRSAYTKIDAERSSIGNKLNVVKFQNQMQCESPLAIDQVGGRGAASDQGKCVVRNSKHDLLSAAGRGEVDNAFVPVHFERVNVESWRTKCCCRPTDLLAFLSKRDRRLDGFRGFLPCLTVQVGNKIRTQRFTLSIRDLVQGKGVALLESPTFRAHVVERYSELLYRLKQHLRLFIGRFKRQPNRSIHTAIVPYVMLILSKVMKGRGSLRQAGYHSAVA